MGALHVRSISDPLPLTGCGNSFLRKNAYVAHDTVVKDKWSDY
jgi:hypothetical protein